MTGIEEAKSQVAQARKKIKEAREKLKIQREQAKKTREQLEKAKSKLPVRDSARALRQGNFAGLEGRNKRRQIKKIEENYKSKKEEVKKFEKNLEEYEKTKLVPVEKQVEAKAREIADYEDTQRAIKLAERMFRDRIPYGFTTGKVYKYLRKMYLLRNLEKRAFAEQVNKFQIANPTEKLQIDWKNLRIKGIQSGALGKTLSLKDYNKEIDSIKKESIKVTSINPKIISIPNQKVLDIGNLNNTRILNVNQTSAINVPNKINFTGSVISEYKPYNQKPYVPKEKSILKKIVSLPSIALASAREFSSSVASQISAEKSLGLGNVGAYSYKNQNNEIITKKVWYGTPIVKIPTAQQFQNRLSQININDNLKKLNELDNKIKQIEKSKIDVKGSWKGTDKEYKKYLDIYNKRKEKYEEYKKNEKNYERTRYINVLGSKRDIRNFNPNRPFETVSKLITTPIGAGTETLYYKLNEGNIGKKRTYYTPSFGTQQFDLLTGKPIDYYKKNTIVLKKEDIRREANILGKGAELFSQANLYATPIGTGLFAGSVLNQFGKSNYNPITFIKENPIETALIGTTALGIGVSKGIRMIKNKAITKAVESEIKNLEKTPFKGVIRIYEKDGKVYGDLYKETEKGRQIVSYEGKLKKTEKGFKFIPSGKGEAVTTGIVKPKYMNERVFTSGQTFEIGSRGKNIKIGEFGNLKFFEELGTTTIIPKKSYFGIEKLPEKSSEIKKAIKSIEEQIRKPTLNGEIIKDISLPVGQRNTLIKLNKNLALRTNPQEVSTIITFPKINKEKLIGFRGGGKKSSSQVFKELSERQKQVILPTTKEISRAISEGTSSSLKSSERLSQKMISGLPIGGSIYAGTGLYERQGFISIKPKIQQQISQKVSEQVSIKKVKIIPRINFTTSNIQINKQKQIPKQISKELINQSLKPTQKEITISKTSQSTKQKQSLLQKERTKQKQEQKTIQNEMVKISTEKIKPKVPKSLFRFIRQAKEKRKVQDINRELYKIYGKRYGKFREIGKAKTKEEAKNILLKFQKGTLGRSAFVEINKKKLSIRELGLGSEFRPSKMNESIIVQKRQFSLGTFGERREIKKSRRKKRRGFLFR